MRLRKFRTDSGALSGYISRTIWPASVSSVTHFEAMVLTSALSKGSIAGGSGVGVGRVLAFMGVGDGACAIAKVTENNPAIKNVKQTRTNIGYIFCKIDSSVK